MHSNEVDVGPTIVRRLLAEQMPELAELHLSIVEPWGTDNAIWRLGDELVVRFPRIASAEGQIGREAEWLPRLAPYLGVAIPDPVAVGAPGCGFPFAWAVHRWLPGDGAALHRMRDAVEFATDLADVVLQLRTVPTNGIRAAVNRARPLADYDDATRQAIKSASHLIDTDAALTVWEEALHADPHAGPPVFVHGDLEGNCLVDKGRLAGLVDFGLACAGDPAVDVQVVWSPLFTPESRQVFLDLLDVDEAMLARSQGAAINQACGALPYYLDTYPLIVERSWHKLAQLGVTRRR